MAQAALLNSPAKIKIASSSCHKNHTAKQLMIASRVVQLLLGRVLNLFQDQGSNKLG
jgi:hypothetical protein